jgi:hypothetical protein
VTAGQDLSGEAPIGPQKRAGARARAYTCGGCDNRWTGASYAHCSACHRTFIGVRMFDKHRRLGGCLDPAIMRTKAGDPIMRLEAGIWRSYERDSRQW